ncbi:hypothetical protein GF325_06040, partial [Candidatus Bathyarchaeota archaeon]|nr:hypothetical protein [Candidatus Bathyarchaeota archaeon]
MRWSFKFSLVVIPFLVIGVLFAFAFQSFKPYPYDFTLAGGETRAIEIPPRFTTVNIDTSASDVVAHFFMETPPNDNITETNSIQTDLVVLGNYTYCRAYLTENAWMHVQWNTTGTQFDLRIIESERYFRNFISGEGYYDFEYSDDKIATSGARNTTADGPYTYYYMFRNTDVDGSITLNMTVHRMNYNLTGALDT